MAICQHCKQEMHEAAGCVLDLIETVDGPLSPIKYGDELDPTMTPDTNGIFPRCGDCAALPGNYHHIGCDIEECPRCHRQLISCGCIINDSEETTTVQ